MNAWLDFVNRFENDPTVTADQWRRIARKAAESADDWESMHKNFVALMATSLKGVSNGIVEI